MKALCPLSAFYYEDLCTIIREEVGFHSNIATKRTFMFSLGTHHVKSSKHFDL